MYFHNQARTTEGRKRTQILFCSSNSLYASAFFFIESRVKTKSLGCCLAGQLKCRNLMDTDTGQRGKGLCFNCHSLPAAALHSPAWSNKSTQRGRGKNVKETQRGSSMNAGGAASKPSFDRRGIVWIEVRVDGGGYCAAAACPHSEVAGNLKTLSFRA